MISCCLYSTLLHCTLAHCPTAHCPLVHCTRVLCTLVDCALLRVQEKALVDQWLEVEHGTYNAVCAPIVAERVFKPRFGGTTDEARVAELKKKVRKEERGFSYQIALYDKALCSKVRYKKPHCTLLCCTTECCTVLYCTAFGPSWEKWHSSFCRGGKSRAAI